MALPVQEAREHIASLFIAYLGRPPENKAMNFYVDQLNAYADEAEGNIGDALLKLSAEIYANAGGAGEIPVGSNVTSEEFVTWTYQNVLGRDPDEDGLEYYVGLLDSGAISREVFVHGFLDNVRGQEEGRDFDYVSNRVDVAVEFSKWENSNDSKLKSLPYDPKNMLAGVNEDPATKEAALEQIANAENVGKSLVLTTGVDNIVGTTADETIDGSRAILGGAQFETLGSADRIDGGGGVDTLFVQGAVAGGSTVTPNSVKNVEILHVENLGTAAYTLNLQNADSSVKTVKVSNTVNAGGTVTINNNPSALTNIVLENVSQAVTVASAAAAVAGDNALNVAVSSVTGSAALSIQGYETVTLSSNGAVDNVLGRVTDAALKTLNIEGSANLTLTLDDAGATNATPNLTTINASAATGRVNVTLDANNATQAVAFTGGSGNDTLNTNGSYNRNAVLDGGEGVDTLVLNNDQAVGTTAVQSNVKNFENLQVSGLNGTLNVQHFGATGLVVGGNLAGNSTVNFATGTNALNLQDKASATFGLTVNVASTATTDGLNLTVGTATAGNTWGTGVVTINGAETVNLSSIGGANTFGGAFTLTDTAATEALVITGSQNITFSGAVRADTINASGMTGTAALTLNGGTGGTATAITGTANSDVLRGSTAGDIINGGAGNDTIQTQVVPTAGNAVAAQDILTGGAGNDTFVLIGNSAANAAYTAAARVTDFTVGTAGATDLIQLGSAAAAYNAQVVGQAGNVSGSVVLQNIAQNTNVAAASGADVYKFTAGVAFTTDLATTFSAAIGSATVTDAANAAASNVFVTLYDTTNARAVIATVNTGAGNQDLSSADAASIRLVGTIDMTAADYANLSATHFADFL